MQTNWESSHLAQIADSPQLWASLPVGPAPTVSGLKTRPERFITRDRVNPSLPRSHTCSLLGALSAWQPTTGVFKGVHQLYITPEQGKWTHYRSNPLGHARTTTASLYDRAILQQ